jgi:tripartite-type tricarboxylate transporter receptor subunit TctC
MSERGTKVNRFRFCLWVFFCFPFLFCVQAQAQKKEFPERSIEIIAQTPGSLGDMWVRSWSEDFSKSLKVPVVVTNKGGALTQWIALSMAKPDGYTLAFFSYPSMIAYAISSKPPFDMFKDFVPIGAFGIASTVLTVEKSSPFTTFESLLDFAKKNPKKLKCATPGIHLHDHLSVELIKEQTGADIVTVPFKGSTEAVTALLGKHVDMISIGPAPLVSLIRAGRVRPLLSVNRLREFPDVPLFSERGLGEAGLVNWTAIFTLSAVPKDIQKKLADNFEKIAKDPKIIGRIDQLGFTHDYLASAAFGNQIQKDYQKIASLVKRLGISDQ